MKIVFVHGHMFNAHTWSEACAILRKDGIDLLLFSQQQSAERAMAVLETEPVDIFIGKMFNDLPFQSELMALAGNAAMRVGSGWDMPPSFSTFPQEEVGVLNQYLDTVCLGNYVNGIRYIAARAGMKITWEPPRPVRTHGVYHPDAAELFSSTTQYLEWYIAGKNPEEKVVVIGVLAYYGQIAEKNHDDIIAVIRAIEDQDMIPLCVCSEGAQDAGLPLPERYPWYGYFEASRSYRFKHPGNSPASQGIERGIH